MNIFDIKQAMRIVIESVTHLKILIYFDIQRVEIK